MNGVAAMSSAERLKPAGDLVERLRFWHLVVVFLFFAGFGLTSMPLFEPDEGRYAEIPREMLDSGDFVTPRLNGVLYFEKPALYYWLTAASLRLFGQNELGARLPSLFAGLAGLFLTYALGRSMGGRRVGVYAVLVLGVSPLWVVFSRLNAIDMTVSVLILATLACFWWADRRAAGGVWWWYAMVSASALAVLTKGLIGVVIPGAVIFFYLLLSRRFRVLKRVPWVTGTLLFTAITVPWHLLVAERNPSFLWFYFVHEHLMRYTTETHARTGPIWYFLPVIAVGLLPWSGLLPAAARLVCLRDAGSRAAWRRPEVAFLIAWAGFVLLFFSASSSKLIPYILPGLPPLAILCGLTLADVERSGSRVGIAARWGLAGAGVLLLVLLAAFLWVSTGHGEELLKGQSIQLPVLAAVAAAGAVLALVAIGAWLRGAWPAALAATGLAGASLTACIVLGAFPAAEMRSAKPLAACLAELRPPPGALAGYRTYPRTLPFYIGRQLDLVDYSGELSFGISKLSDAERRRRYPTVAEFSSRWHGEAPIYLVTERRFVAAMEEDGLRPGSVLLEHGKFVLLVNQQAGDAGAVGCE